MKSRANWKCNTLKSELEAAGVLKEIGWALLGNYCLTYSRYLEAAADVENNGQIIWIESSTRTG
jgi:phage terminase small subunit